MKILIPILLLLTSVANAQRVGVVFYGNVQKRDVILREIKLACAGIYNEKVVWVDDRPLPRAAYRASRNRYRADRLLDDLVVRECDRVIAITDSDISTTAHGYYDWGVCGLASMSRHRAVVSTYRTKRLPITLDVVIHELGHTRGLDHCTDPACYMEGYNGTLQQHKIFCEKHLQMLKL